MTRTEFEDQMIAAVKSEPGAVDSIIASFLGLRAGLFDRCGYLAWQHEMFDRHEAAILKGEEVTEDEAQVMEVGA